MENEMEKNELIPEEIPAAEEAEEIVIAPEAEAADEAEEVLPEEVSKPEKKKKNTYMGTKISVVILGEMEKSGDRMEQVQRGMRKLLRVMDMFIILIVVIVSWVFIHVKSYKICEFTVCQL